MSDPFAREVHCLLGLPFDAVDLGGAVRRIEDAVARRERCFLSTPNLNWLVACRSDTALRDSVADSDLSIADGMPLVWVAGWLGAPIRERVAGSAVFESLRAGTARRIKVFFFGGPAGVAAAACDRLNQAACGMVCVGHECPGFGTVEEMSSERTIAAINASEAEFVVVALGARKGQAWIERNRARLAAPVISHLGAVVNFVAGTVSRAPSWMQRSGLEWVWRIKEETGLWRRYFFDGLGFLGLLGTRVLPHMWFRLMHTPTLEAGPASAEEREEGGCTVIQLRGALTAERLGPVRDSFRRAAQAGLDVRLELAAVTYLDTAGVGLLMMLQGHCRRHGRRLELPQPGDAVRHILRYCCAEHLLQG